MTFIIVASWVAGGAGSCVGSSTLLGLGGGDEDWVLIRFMGGWGLGVDPRLLAVFLENRKLCDEDWEGIPVLV